MDEKNNSIEKLEDYVEKAVQKSSPFNFASLWTVIVLHWQWFLLSLLICMLSGWLYIRYTRPTYQLSARILIKDDNSRNNNSAQMLANMDDLGFLTNSEGIYNEIEVMNSRMLVRDVVRELKLYTEYRKVGTVIKPLAYLVQPVSVDLDPVHLDSLDKTIYTNVRSIRLGLTRSDGYYVVQGSLLSGGEEKKTFAKKFKSLPASFKTDYGVLTFSASVGRKMGDDDAFEITILPPMQVATRYLAAMKIEPVSKVTSVAHVTLKDENYLRGMDFLRQLVSCYNRQANADKNEIALRTEEFINDRMAKINAELGSTEGALEDFKRRNAVTNLNVDASQSVQMSSEFSARLSQANSQIQMLDYLREYVNNPENKNQIIPSNVGLTDDASTKLIANYNQAVQDRNRMLKAASEQAPQVQTITATINELQSSIQTALIQARRSADIARQGIQSEYSKYQGRVSAAPIQERVLTQIGRQQDVKSGLYLMLLQKREENNIALAATADKGKLLDDPLFEGRIRPRGPVVLFLSIFFGLLIPAVYLFMRSLFSYTIGGYDDIARLTTLPLIANVPVASDDVRTATGIVVHENKNSQMDEIFRSMRTKIRYTLKENEKVILFTSSMSGEGKTFNAANLALSFALLGKKVVLCGLDIRKPALSRLFDLSEHHEGITRILTQEKVTESELQEQIVNSGVNSNLDLLMSGPIPPNPTELLAHSSFGQIISMLRQLYDYVILDTAPVGVVSDTLEISSYADMTVYICRADYTPKSSLDLLNSLDSEKSLPNPCVVLNGIDMSKRRYGYYYGYGRYGKYGRYGSYSKYGAKYGHYGTYGHYNSKEDHSIKQ